LDIAIRRKCDIVVHNIQKTLDVHIEQLVLQVNVVNVFNMIFCMVIFKELYAIGGQLSKLIPFVCSFLCFRPPTIL
jgi:hypothetical protein